MLSLGAGICWTGGWGGTFSLEAWYGAERGVCFPFCCFRRGGLRAEWPQAVEKTWLELSGATMERGLTWLSPSRAVLGRLGGGSWMASEKRAEGARPKAAEGCALPPGAEVGTGGALPAVVVEIGMLTALILAGTSEIGIPIHSAASGHFFRRAFSASNF